MSTTNPTPQFRPLTPKDMEEYEKELKASLASKNSPQENTSDEADPKEPQEPAKPTDDGVDWKKRFADQTTYLNEQIRLRKLAEKEKEDALKAKEQHRFASPEEVEEFRSKYEISPALQQIIADQAAERTEALRQEFLERESLKNAEVNKQYTDSAKMNEAHPDWKAFDQGGELNQTFMAWLTQQPIKIQEMADYNTNKDIDLSIAVLSMFKAQVQVKKPTGPTTKKPSTTNPASRSPAEVPTQKEGAFDVLSWEKAFDNALKTGNKPLQNKLYDDMQRARKEGRLSY